MRVAIALICALAVLSGCTTTLTPVEQQGPVQLPKERDRYHVRIPTHDGIELAATVYQPELAPGETAPLIIATHGFGGFRAKRPFSLYGRTMLTGEAAIEAWKRGYWVVFYDQRGWGESDGVVNLMDPDKEVRDVSSVIDWALAHLPGIARTAQGDWAIGMIGESYGGAAQTLASFGEPRLRALVPLATWHDLNALAPAGHMKTNWGAQMLGLGSFSSGFDTGFMVRKPMRSGFSGTVSRDAQKMFRERSPVHYCEQGLTPQADALLIHGFRDTMFPMQEALDNRECFRRGGNDVRLIAIQGGHILPWPVQKWSGKPLFNTEDAIQCGAYEETLVNTVVAWWDEKLRGAERVVPELCVTLDDETGLDTFRFPDVRETFIVPRSKVSVPLAGLFEWLMIPWDQGWDITRRIWWNGADRRFYTPNGGFGRPRFIPLYIAHEDEVLSGIPEIDLRVNGTASVRSTRLFVGIGVQRAGMRRVWVASEQLTPLPKKGHYQQELPAVSMRLRPGDRVGLVVYGFTWQYFFNPSFWPSTATISGEAKLPIMTVADER